jgi:hypothetical protein
MYCFSSGLFCFYLPFLQAGSSIFLLHVKFKENFLQVLTGSNALNQGHYQKKGLYLATTSHGAAFLLKNKNASSLFSFMGSFFFKILLMFSAW